VLEAAMPSLDAQHEAVRAAAREFVARAVLPIADRLDRAGQESPEVIIRSLAIVAEEPSCGWLSVGSVMTQACRITCANRFLVLM